MSRPCRDYPQIRFKDMYRLTNRGPDCFVLNEDWETVADKPNADLNISADELPVKRAQNKP